MDVLEDDFEPDAAATAENAHSIGATDFAKALTASLNTHTTSTQKLFGKHGLLARYQRIAHERSPTPTNLAERLE
jgi:hypothetical protein